MGAPAQTGVHETRAELVFSILCGWGSGPPAKAMVAGYGYLAAINGVSVMTVRRILKEAGKI
jgi:hypothetical protein